MCCSLSQVMRQTALHRAAFRPHNVVALRLLLAMGADPNKTDVRAAPMLPNAVPALSAQLQVVVVYNMFC